MNASQVVLPKRPYLAKAMYDWLVDSGLTPHLLVDTSVIGVKVPRQFIKDEQIVLNVAPHAVGHLNLQNEEITFNARFGGVAQSIVIPMVALLAIYARENGEGMMFEPEPYYDNTDDSVENHTTTTTNQSDSKAQGNTNKKSFLRIVE